MTKPITTLLLVMLFVSGSAWAGWVEVGETTDSKGTVFIDPATIRKDLEPRRVWKLINWKQPIGEEFSWRILFEIDCKQERARTLAFTTHAEPMAKSEWLFSKNEPLSFGYIAPQTTDAKIMNIVCAK